MHLQAQVQAVRQEVGEGKLSVGAALQAVVLLGAVQDFLRPHRIHRVVEQAGAAVAVAAKVGRVAHRNARQFGQHVHKRHLVQQRGIDVGEQQALPYLEAAARQARVQAHAVALKRRPLHHAVLPEVAPREQEVAGAFVAGGPARKTQAVVLHLARPEKLLLPVRINGIRISGRALHGAGHAQRGVEAGVAVSHSRAVGPFAVVGQVELAVHAFHTSVAVEADFGLAGLAFFSGDENNAVGPARAVHGRRGGILQHRGRFHVGRAQVADVVGPQPVNYIQRVAARAGGAHPANQHVGYRAGVAGAFDLHAGHAALQALHQRGYRGFGGFAHVEAAHGAAHVLAVLGQVAHYHHVAQRLAVHGQRHIHAGAAAHQHFLAGKTHEGEHERRALGRIQGVAAVGIGLSAHAGAFHQHVHAGNARAAGINNAAGYSGGGQGHLARGR